MFLHFFFGSPLFLLLSCGVFWMFFSSFWVQQLLYGIPTRFSTNPMISGLFRWFLEAFYMGFRNAINGCQRVLSRGGLTRKTMMCALWLRVCTRVFWEVATGTLLLGHVSFRLDSRAFVVAKAADVAVNSAKLYFASPANMSMMTWQFMSLRHYFATCDNVAANFAVSLFHGSDAVASHAAVSVFHGMGWRATHIAASSFPWMWWPGTWFRGIFILRKRWNGISCCGIFIWQNGTTWHLSRGVFISRKLMTWHPISRHLCFAETDDVAPNLTTSLFCGAS